MSSFNSERSKAADFGWRGKGEKLRVDRQSNNTGQKVKKADLVKATNREHEKFLRREALEKFDTHFQAVESTKRKVDSEQNSANKQPKKSDDLERWH